MLPFSPSLQPFLPKKRPLPVPLKGVSPSYHTPLLYPFHLFLPYPFTIPQPRGKKGSFFFGKEIKKDTVKRVKRVRVRGTGRSKKGQNLHFNSLLLLVRRRSIPFAFFTLFTVSFLPSLPYLYGVISFFLGTVRRGKEGQKEEPNPLLSLLIFFTVPFLPKKKDPSLPLPLPFNRLRCKGLVLKYGKG